MSLFPVLKCKFYFLVCGVCVCVFYYYSFIRIIYLFIIIIIIIMVMPADQETIATEEIACYSRFLR